jgi:hypothetical protein
VFGLLPLDIVEGVFRAEDDIELAAARLQFRVNLVWEPCCGDSATLVVVFWEAYFGVDRVTDACSAEADVWVWVARVRVTALDEVVLDDTVEEERVIFAVADET